MSDKIFSEETMTKLAVKQIRHIAMNGCAGIKCKYCIMKMTCDHFPDHSKQIAIDAIMMAKAK